MIQALLSTASTKDPGHRDVPWPRVAQPLLQEARGFRQPNGRRPRRRVVRNWHQYRDRQVLLLFDCLPQSQQAKVSMVFYLSSYIAIVWRIKLLGSVIVYAGNRKYVCVVILTVFYIFMELGGLETSGRVLIQQRYVRDRE